MDVLLLDNSFILVLTALHFQEYKYDNRISWEENLCFLTQELENLYCGTFFKLCNINLY